MKQLFKYGFLSLILSLFTASTGYAQSADFPGSPFSPGFQLKGLPRLNQNHPDSPAFSADIKGLRFGITADERTDNDANDYVSGENMFFVWPVPFIKAAIGGSAGIMRFKDADTGRFVISASNALNNSFFIGLKYTKIASSPAPQYDAGGFGAAFRFRISDNLSIVYQIDSLLMNKINGVPSDRTHKLETMLDFRNRYGFMMWLGAATDERRNDYAFNTGLRFRLFDGFNLYATASYVSAERSFYSNGNTVYPGDLPEWRIGAGLSVVLDSLTVSGGYVSGTNSFSSSLIWDEKPVEKSVIPEAEYAFMININKKYNEQIHFNNLNAYRICLSDYKCKALVFKIDTHRIPWIYAEEWAKLIEKARKSGRYVITYAYNFGNTTYAATAGSTKIYVFPGADVDLRGLFINKLYFRDLLEKFGLNAQFIKFGKYKSAPEMFMKRSPSEESFSQTAKILKEAEYFFFKMLLRRRGLTLKKIHDIFNRGTTDPKTAMQAGFVDGIAYPSSMMRIIFKTTGKILMLKNAVSINTSLNRKGNGIAVFLINGDIVNKKGGSLSPFKSKQQAVSGEIIGALKAAASDIKIKALLLRINSPGGSASASELLWHTVLMISRIKPVYVSFGETAASGGYYMAAPARKIFASDFTVTGSIGIFGGKISVKKLLNKSGIGVTIIKRSPHADMESPARPYTSEEIKLIKQTLKYHYTKFLKAVASGRKLSLAKVEKLAEGRIYSGYSASRKGLVDFTGGFYDAISYTLKKSNLNFDAPLYVAYPPVKNSLKSKIRKIIKDNIPIPFVKLMKKVPDSLYENAPWTRLPYVFEIR